MTRAIVVGGGPGGMMAAGICAAQGRKTLLIEKNPQLGKKLRITGKGRCNLTNQCSVEDMVAAAQGGKFLYTALSAFPPQAVMDFFTSLGVALKTERGRRVFPQSDSAHQVADALEHFALNQGVRRVRDQVLAVETENGSVTGVRTRSGVMPAGAVLLACGGASYPGTGSDGSGSRLARALGHTIIELAPSLVPLVEQGETCRRLMGLSLRNCGVQVRAKGKKKPVYTDFGELLFTHFGLSGPTILSASAHMRPMEAGKYTVHVDLKPGLDQAQLDARLLRDLGENKNRLFSNSLDRLLPQKLIPLVIERSGIPGDTRCHTVTKEQRQRLLEALKDFTVEIAGFRPMEEAIVTAGGVSLKEVNPRTMESKLVKGLYFAGEVLDVDAPTGGYNLQIAFSTGRLAGESMGKQGGMGT